MNDETMQRLRETVKTSLMLVVTAGSDPKRRDAAKYQLDAILQALAAEIERAEVAGMEKAKNIIADKMKRDIKALEPYLKDLQSKTGGDK